MEYSKIMEQRIRYFELKYDPQKKYVIRKNEKVLPVKINKRRKIRIYAGAILNYLISGIF